MMSFSHDIRWYGHGQVYYGEIIVTLVDTIKHTYKLEMVSYHHNGVFYKTYISSKEYPYWIELLNSYDWDITTLNLYETLKEEQTWQ